MVECLVSVGFVYEFDWLCVEVLLYNVEVVVFDFEWCCVVICNVLVVFFVEVL